MDGLANSLWRASNILQSDTTRENGYIQVVCGENAPAVPTAGIMDAQTCADAPPNAASSSVSASSSVDRPAPFVSSPLPVHKVPVPTPTNPITCIAITPSAVGPPTATSSSASNPVTNGSSSMNLHPPAVDVKQRVHSLYSAASPDHEPEEDAHHKVHKDARSPPDQHAIMIHREEPEAEQEHGHTPFVQPSNHSLASASGTTGSYDNRGMVAKLYSLCERVQVGSQKLSDGIAEHCSYDSLASTECATIRRAAADTAVAAKRTALAAASRAQTLAAAGDAEAAINMAAVATVAMAEAESAAARAAAAKRAEAAAVEAERWVWQVQAVGRAEVVSPEAEDAAPAVSSADTAGVELDATESHAVELDASAPTEVAELSEATETTEAAQTAEAEAPKVVAREMGALEVAHAPDSEAATTSQDEPDARRERTITPPICCGNCSFCTLECGCNTATSNDPETALSDLHRREQALRVTAAAVNAMAQAIQTMGETAPEPMGADGELGTVQMRPADASSSVIHTVSQGYPSAKSSKLTEASSARMERISEGKRRQEAALPGSATKRLKLRPPTPIVAVLDQELDAQLRVEGQERFLRPMPQLEGL